MMTVEEVFKRHEKSERDRERLVKEYEKLFGPFDKTPRRKPLDALLRWCSADISPL